MIAQGILFLRFTSISKIIAVKRRYLFMGRREMAGVAKEQEWGQLLTVKN